jgi:hypothetical protein
MKMKKMMVLMLVFFLGITAGMNAQVHIGGTVDPNPNALLDVNKDTITVTADNQLNIGNWIYGQDGRIRIGNMNPHATAVLDLNADNTATPARNIGGLAVLRVSLDTLNSQLNGATPINGTVVYNTNASMKNGGGVGLYTWITNKWNRVATNVLTTGIIFSPSGSIRLLAGTTYSLDVTVNPLNVTNPKLSWSSSDPTVATVSSSSGKIKGVANGTAVITATAMDESNRSQSITVNVSSVIFGHELIGSNSYYTVTLPDNLGTWTLSNSKEGTPSRIIGNAYYYSSVAAQSACPAPYEIPSYADFVALNAFLTNASPMDRLFGIDGSVSSLPGQAGTSTLTYFGTRAYWWGKTSGTNTPALIWLQESERFAPYETTTLNPSSVRCIRK